MTPSGAGVLQGFRRDYQWQGTTYQQVSCVANAVPPPLARAMVAELIGAAAA
jgi:site-specific DNA-cytosine methylase